VIQFDLPVRQIAYFAADVRVAALEHHLRFGSGPFFVAEHIPLRQSLHRGAARLWITPPPMANGARS